MYALVTIGDVAIRWRTLFAVVIAIPQLKCTSNGCRSIQNRQLRAYVARRYVYAITTKAWKKRAAPVRHLLNTARYPLKTRTINTWQCIILRIHRPSKIRRATQKPCYSVMQCIRAAFTNISAPPPLAAIRKIIRLQKCCKYSIWNWKYSKITTDEAFWSPSCCNSWL